MITKFWKSVLTGFLCTMLWCMSAIQGQMVNPSIDNPDEPFSYFSKPTDELGVMDGKWGTEVTPEGYLYTGFGELMFFTGNPPCPVNQRVKTLLDGYLPVISYTFDRQGIAYTISAFAATLDGNLESPMMNFVRVSVKNPGTEQRAVFFSIGLRYEDNINTDAATGDYRFVRPVASKDLGGYEQTGVAFNSHWSYGFSGDTFLRSDSVMYVFPDEPSPELTMTLKSEYNYVQNLSTRELPILPTTPVGIVTYRIILKPGEMKTLDFKMPYTPLPSGDALVDKLRMASYDDYLSKTVASWDTIISKGIDVEIPEPKVEDTFKASLIYDLIARNKEDGYYIQKVNDLHYHAFWIRDAVHIIHMYLLSGYPEIARQCLDFFPRWQQPDGNFVSNGGQFDGWGQTMWIYGQYYRFTHDNEFAEKVYPSILKAFDWLVKARNSDPMHLIPATKPGDNENITGHITGHDFWALDGLKNMIAIANGLRKTDDAKKFEEEYNSLYGALLSRLKVVTAKTGGYITPGLDGQNPPGQDWGNMNTLYPEALFPPFDSMVTATLDSTHAKYREGIMTYGDGAFLHDYLTFRNPEAELVRGEQKRPLKELYALLVHTSAANAGFEFSIHPWGTRDFGRNLTPHGRYAAEFRTLLRNMMVREQGDTLHLLSSISPDWVGLDRTISVRHAPTYFGEVNFSLTFNYNGAELRLNNHFTTEPGALVLHLPWFADVEDVTADGKEITVQGDTVDLPMSAREVEITGSLKPEVPQTGYEDAVRTYENQYRERYQEFLKTGKWPVVSIRQLDSKGRFLRACPIWTRPFGG